MIKNRLLRLEKKRLGDNYCSLKKMLLNDGFIDQAQHDGWAEGKPLPSNVKTAADVIRFLDRQEENHG